jgi:hypothetical protein
VCVISPGRCFSGAGRDGGAEDLPACSVGDSTGLLGLVCVISFGFGPSGAGGAGGAEDLPACSGGDSRGLDGGVG